VVEGPPQAPNVHTALCPAVGGVEAFGGCTKLIHRRDGDSWLST
jgi:hypothetical protein